MEIYKAGARSGYCQFAWPCFIKKTCPGYWAEATSVEEAIKNKDVVIISIPQKNIPLLPVNLFKQLAEDVVVIETGNYYPSLRDGNIPALQQSGIDSLWVQQQLGRPVVKAFNAILATSIYEKAKPAGDKNRVAIPVSGDDAKTKQVVFKLVDELGFDPFDVGTIAQSWKQQPGSPIYCRDLALAELKKRADALGADWAAMRNTILAKRLADEVLMKADYPAYLKALQD
nr:hypothetical protein [uncultured Mucilaginibacter sp.]